LDYGIYDHVFEASHKSFAAYGVGIHLYINTIAVPGFGIEVGRNDEFMGDFINFSVGMSI
jgi:hypothetical protein